MPQVKINFNSDEATIWAQMLNCTESELEAKLETHLTGIANTHEIGELDKQFKNKTKQQKKDLLNP